MRDWGHMQRRQVASASRYTCVTVLTYLMSGDWRRVGLNCPSVLLIITNDLLGTSVTRVGR